jgi:biopolymer transport protein ExbB
MLLKEIMIVGGPVMWLIAICSVIAVFVFIEKLLYLHRIQINVGELVKGLLNVLKKGNIIEAVSLCDETPGPAAHILRTAILSYEEGSEDITQAVQDSALGEMPRIEARMNILATIAYIAPLLGLLGTVIGMIGVFNTINDIGAFVNAKDLAKDIGEALYTTAGGLCVSIPSYIAYNYLVSRIEAITVDMEKAASEIIYFFKKNQKNTNPDK